MNTDVNVNLPLYSLTIGQFVDLIKNTVGMSAQKERNQADSKKFIKGVVGISKLFGVSHKTAQAWKNTWLGPACTQRARTILVDVDRAMELFNERRAEL